MSGDEIMYYSPQIDSLQSVPGRQATQSALQHAGPCAPSGGDSTGKERPPPVEDDPNQFACPVVEEVPSPTNDASSGLCPLDFEFWQQGGAHSPSSIQFFDG